MRPVKRAAAYIKNLDKDKENDNEHITKRINKRN